MTQDDLIYVLFCNSKSSIRADRAARGWDNSGKVGVRLVKLSGIAFIDLLHHYTLSVLRRASPISLRIGE